MDKDLFLFVVTQGQSFSDCVLVSVFPKISETELRALCVLGRHFTSKLCPDLGSSSGKDISLRKTGVEEKNTTGKDSQSRAEWVWPSWWSLWKNSSLVFAEQTQIKAESGITIPTLLTASQ